MVVEVDLAPGLPGVQLVGLPDKAIQESRERVRSALGSARSATATGTALRQGDGSGAEAAQPNASCRVLVHSRTN